MDPVLVILLAGACLVGYLLVAFAVGTLKHDNSVMDIFYGPAYLVLALSALLLGGTFSARPVLVTVLVGLWATRLAVYVYVRNRGKPEDPRYQQMRERWGTHVQLKSFLRVYLFQGLVIFLVGFPAVYVSVADNPPLTWLDWLGTFLWCVGFYFETGGDYQLYKFKQDPANKGRVMTGGLWAYTQHPNYFGEVTQWWALWLVVASVPFGVVLVFSPLYITFQIVKVSGVRLLNKRYADDPEYQAYARRTSAFFPWFPKRASPLATDTAVQDRPAGEKIEEENLVENPGKTGT